MNEKREPACASLRQLLSAVGDPVIGLLAAPNGLDTEINGIAILDADEEPGDYHPAGLVLIIVARGRRGLRLARSAALRGAAAVAVKLEHEDDVRDLQDLAAETGAAVLGIRPEASWTQLGFQARAVMADAGTAAPAEVGQPRDLFTLAQTVATLTGGNVTIEDPSSRVLAYSRSDEADIDELRRLSILGLQGPADYLALLRRWGVFERLRAGDDVIDIEAHPELGIRRRLAIGIRVDEQLLGSIWVQEGREEMAPDAGRALLGAARAAALQLVRRRTGAQGESQVEDSLLTGVLQGHVHPRTLADGLGTDPDRPAVVVAFELGGGVPDPGDDGEVDRPESELRRSVMVGLITVHTSAYRRPFMVTDADPRVYALLPGLPAHGAESLVGGLAEAIVEAAGQRLKLDVHAAVGSVVPCLDEITESREAADRVLDVIARDGGRRVATIGDVRSEVLVGEVLTLLGENPRLRDPRVSALVAYDAEHDSGLVSSMLAYIGALGNVREAAESLHVHPNTLRYRLRRADAVSGIDLANAYQCLFSHLQLLLEVREEAPPAER
ncbi:PucR family transcriptional regulator [Streptomyces sp. 6N223]|uniref:PucR family transcriptional regulator n=1 Tax=Streptomyces sp. 6N223 TaxID=3457412 RepID=UPI003FD6AA29